MKPLIIAALLLATQASAEPVATLFADYSKASAELHLAPLEISYEAYLNALLDESDTARQRRVFDAFSRRVASIDPATLSPCEQLDLRKLEFELRTNLAKLDVVQRLRANGGKEAVKPGGLHAMPDGRALYRYTLRRWLSSDASPEQLMAWGRTELDTVLARYRALQARMGYAGRDADFSAYLAGPEFLYPAGQTPQSDYEERQATVFRNLEKLFLPTGAKPALIRQSDRGASFRADGYYDPDSRTFYYNLSKPQFERRVLDYLTLHESTPGHHYQSHYTEYRHACTTALPSVFYAAFAEGWGAYVEEFGKQLGLYRTPADELGAIEWDLVRSIRVVLDVGINDQGWTREQAFAYWHEKLPMLPAVADREITRVRDWPAQAITYKWGAHTFRQLRAQAQAKPGFDIRVFHDEMLKYGPMPLDVLVKAQGAAPAIH